ncbi:tetratricopeptide repeat protein [Spirillospora sp. NPDC127200]
MTGAHERFTTEFRRLYEAAGRPAEDELVERAWHQLPPVELTSGEVAGWLDGEVPPESAALTFVIAYLQERVLRRQRTSPARPRQDYAPRPMPWWRRQRAEAEAERRRVRRAEDGEEAPAANAHGTTNDMSGEAGPVLQGRDFTGVYINVPPPGGPAPPPALDKPSAPVVNLPHQAGDIFVGRREELERLDEVFAAPGSVGILHGLGGVGKSALAAHWATAGLAERRVTWWIDADAPERLAAGLARLAAVLVRGGHDAARGSAAEQAMDWLASHDGWLLVLDDVTDPDHLAPLLARCRTGHILVTTRLAAGWHRVGRTIRMEVPAPHEAAELLARTVTEARPNADLADRETLCAELGLLPLAVEQAAGYLADTGRSPRQYLELLAEHPDDLYAQPPAGGEPGRTVAQVWRATLLELAARSPEAMRVLRVLAWLGPDPVPRSLLDPLAGVLGGQLVLDGAVRRLAVRSMVTLADDGALVVHRLVQAVVRSFRPVGADEEECAPARHEAAALLTFGLAGSAGDPAGRDGWAALMPHASAFARHRFTGDDLVGVSILWGKAGMFHAVEGDRRHKEFLDRFFRRHEARQDVEPVLPLFEAAVAERERALGPDHLETLSARMDLLVLHARAGRAREAVPYVRRLLSDCVRALGAEHFFTLDMYQDLGNICKEAGETALALELFEEGAAAYRRSGHKEHLFAQTLDVDMAAVHRDAGDLRRAEEILEAAEAGLRRTRGGDDLFTLLAIANRAMVHLAAGRSAEAGGALEAAVADSARSLGEDHSMTRWMREILEAARKAAP